MTWLFDLSLYVLIFVVPLISTALRFSFGFGFGYPGGNYYWIGEGIGLAIMITISLLLPLRTPARPDPTRRRTMPALEETSPHKLILRRAPQASEDKRRPD